MLGRVDARPGGLGKIPGHVGNRNYGNKNGALSSLDDQGEKIKYKEWDVHPTPSDPNAPRGEERLVTGSDGSAYYTSSHYDSFTQIR